MRRFMSETKYKINEIFYSVQAEGANAGRPAVFVRFAGCNLKCPFCDTNHEPFVEMTQSEIEAEVNRLDPTKQTDRQAIVVFTGGEPTLQLNDADPNGMCWGRYRCMETNGILSPPRWIEHTTISPKTKLSEDQWRLGDELKFLYGWFDDEYLVEVGKRAEFFGIPCYIQPTADKDGKFDALPAIEFAKAHPWWRLSLQFHKLIDIR